MNLCIFKFFIKNTEIHWKFIVKIKLPEKNYFKYFSILFFPLVSRKNLYEILERGDKNTMKIISHY